MSVSTRAANDKSIAALHRVGSWAFTVLGASQMGLTVLHACVFGPAPEDRPLFEAMRGATRVIAGVSRSWFQLVYGFSLASGVFVLFLGLLNVALAAHATQRGDTIPPGVLAVDAMAALLGLLLAILLLPPLAIFLLAVASVCFCGALHRVKHRLA